MSAFHSRELIDELIGPLARCVDAALDELGFELSSDVDDQAVGSSLPSRRVARVAENHPVHVPALAPSLDRARAMEPRSESGHEPPPPIVDRQAPPHSIPTPQPSDPTDVLSSSPAVRGATRSRLRPRPRDSGHAATESRAGLETGEVVSTQPPQTHRNVDAPSPRRGLTQSELESEVAELLAKRLGQRVPATPPRREIAVENASSSSPDRARPPTASPGAEVRPPTSSPGAEVRPPTSSPEAEVRPRVRVRPRTDERSAKASNEMVPEPTRAPSTELNPAIARATSPVSAPIVQALPPPSPPTGQTSMARVEHARAARPASSSTPYESRVSPTTGTEPPTPTGTTPSMVEAPSSDHLPTQTREPHADVRPRLRLRSRADDRSVDEPSNEMSPAGTPFAEPNPGIARSPSPVARSGGSPPELRSPASSDVRSRGSVAPTPILQTVSPPSRPTGRIPIARVEHATLPSSSHPPHELRASSPTTAETLIPTATTSPMHSNMGLQRISLTHPRAIELSQAPPPTPSLRLLPLSQPVARASTPKPTPASPPAPLDPGDPTFERALTELLREAARRHGIDV
jgi:hypothetical protein